MNRRLVTFFVAVLIGAAPALAEVCAPEKAPETITMNHTVFKAHKKPLVIFNHKKHHEAYDLACTACHHVIKDGKNVWKQGDPVKKCTECHEGTKAKGKMPKAEKIKGYYYNAIHAKCVGCHKAEKKKGKHAPAACKDCHQKE